MSASIPPGFVLILGALLTAVTPGRAHKAWALLAPLAALAVIWLFPAEARIVEHWLDYDLVLAQLNLPTKAFATIFALMAFAGGLYAYETASRTELAAAQLYAGSAIGVTFAGDLITMFMFWELMAIGSTLVVWAAGTEASRLAGRRYVNVHLVGGAILMAGIALHVHATGSILLPRMMLGGDIIDPVVMVAEGGRPWLLPTLNTPGSVLMLIGVLINTGAPPFGSWLPDAYPEASPSGTVFLSAFTTKTSVYVLMVLFAGANVLVWIGCLMTIYGIVYAILENDMRRILAYSIVNQVGFMVCAIGIGTGLAINGATAHAFAHIIYKALLLMSAGSVLLMTQKRKCTDLGGLYKAMPLTMWCGIIGALAISAVPLTSGFTTKSMVTDAAAMTEIWGPVTEVDGQLVWDSLVHPTVAWFVLVAASAGVFLHAGIKFPWFVFFQKDSGLRPADPPRSMKLAMVLFSALCIGIGVFFQPLYAILPFAVAFAPYTGAHVVQMLQLLLFSGLAFFAMLGLLRRTRTITLDVDWLYRRLAPALVTAATFAIEALNGALAGARNAGAARLRAALASAFGTDGALGSVRTTSGMVVWVAVLLAAFLILYYF
jgi:multicomponent Na+:H+ antiporter subunit D